MGGSADRPPTPRGGSPKMGDFPAARRFQSTHPVRSATSGVVGNNITQAVNFNPRTPCGVRLNAIGVAVFDNH